MSLAHRDTWSLELEGLRDRIRRALLLVEQPPLVTSQVTAAGRDALDFDELRETVKLEAIAPNDGDVFAQLLQAAADDEVFAQLQAAGPVDGARIVIQPIACKFCGCTQDSACAVPVAELSDDARNAVDLWRYERGLELGETVPCWWVSLSPPVCSRPSCVEQLEQIRSARAAVIAGADRARTFASLAPEQGGPV